jgi:beta-barrel assembly-enhancing protease
MNKSVRLVGICALASVVSAYVVQSTPQLPDPGNTGVTREQQVQLGQQAVAEVYKQMPVLPDSSPETKYVQQLGGKLVSGIPQQDSWPYQFHVVPQKEINAFALPGGPIFVNIGTITAAENEAQLAGVMSHEISHIYMQHSIKQMKKQQLHQGIAGILGAVLGQAGGALGTLGQLGVGIGSGMLSLKYSRDDEAQADKVGAVLMYKAGYDPVALAQFFETLEHQGGANGPNFLSDHPNPGNRVAAIQQEIQGWAPVNSRVNNQEFLAVKQKAEGVRAYTGQEIAQGAKDNTWVQQNQHSGSMPANLPVSQNSNSPGPAGAAIGDLQYSQVKPSGSFAQTQNNLASISYPSNWQVFPDANGAGMTIAPAAAVSQGSIAYGVVINGVQSPGSTSLDQATNDLVSALQQSNQGLRANGSPRKIQVNGTEGRSVELTGRSPVQQNNQPLAERDWVVTVPQRQGGMLYFVLIAPENVFGSIRPTYQQMLDSAQLK